MCGPLNGQVAFLLLLVVSLAIDVHSTWKAWPTEASQAYLHGGGNCTSAWDCSLHGSCDNVVVPQNEVSHVMSIDEVRNKTRMGQCECYAHYTGSHCSVHVLLLEISLRLDEQKQRVVSNTDAIASSQRHVDKISLRQHRRSSKVVLRSLSFVLLGLFSVWLLLSAPGLHGRIAVGYLWVLLPTLHAQWNSMLLSVPSHTIAEAVAHSRVAS